MNFKKSYLVLILFIAQFTYSQEGLPVYSDYLTDNYYLLHPSMAGIANCTKLRLTGRQQWFGQADAPSLQTLSINGKIGERDGAGMILFNDKNGYHSQKGAKLSYAHHLLFSRDEIDLNQLSFGLNIGFSQSQLDESNFFTNNPTFDPVVFGQIQKATYFNMDFGMSYSYLDFYTHFTVKNALASERKLYTDKEPTNLRRIIVNTGYTFGDSDAVLWEPSVMFQYITQTKESSIDLNLKLYKELDFGKVWGGLSYRRSLDGAQYADGNAVATQNLQYFVPILGVNYKQFMFAYTYTYLAGKINFDNAGFHQLTLGANLFCKPEKYHCNCPANN
ncbi:MAG: type IX secretion system membrane protein PorP/SprF [Flavobacterium sp.]|nr:type IX secretion system membrane protein PorP/SprF [Flavobacterium sp.]